MYLSKNSKNAFSKKNITITDVIGRLARIDFYKNLLKIFLKSFLNLFNFWIWVWNFGYLKHPFAHSKHYICYPFFPLFIIIFLLFKREQALMWLVVSREVIFLKIILVFFKFNRFILNYTNSLKSTIQSNSSMNSLGFLNEFTRFSLWIH